MGIQWVAERYRDRMNAVYPGSVRGLFGVHAAPHGTLDNRGKEADTRVPALMRQHLLG